MLGGDLAGFPNGRRLTDDIIDVALRVVLGVLLPDHQAIADTIGDGVDANDVPFNTGFPYVAYPHSGRTRILTDRTPRGPGWLALGPGPRTTRPARSAR